jgi:hypothetical protein
VPHNYLIIGILMLKEHFLRPVELDTGNHVLAMSELFHRIGVIQSLSSTLGCAVHPSSTSRSLLQDESDNETQRD